MITMKQLIYRELYLSKKSILMTLGVGAMVFLAGALVLLSCRFGNIAKYNEPEVVREMMNAVSTYLPLMIYAIALVAGVDAIPNQIFADHTGGWHKFIKSSGVKAEAYVGAKYLAILILLGASTLLILFLCPVFFLLSGSVHINLTGLIAMLDFVLLITDVNLPLFIWAKKREKALLWSVLPIMLLAVTAPAIGGLIGAGVISEDMIEKLIQRYSDGSMMPIACMVLGILSLLMYLSFKLSVHLAEVEA